MEMIDLLAKHLPKLSAYLNHHWKIKSLPFSLPSQTQSFEKYDFLYVHGLSDFLSFEESMDHHRILFIEEDLEWWLAFLQHPKAKKFLTHPNVEFEYYVDFEQLAFHLAYENLFESFYFYISHNKDSSLKESICYESLSKSISARLILNTDIDNIYNYLMLDTASNGLQINLKGVPTIICGAGPSLLKLKPYLSKLLDHYFFIAAGASVNILNNWGFSPHLAVAIDPKEIQEHYFIKRKDFHTPYCYRNRLHSTALSLVHGPKLYIKGLSNRPLIDMIDTDLEIKGVNLGGGFSSVTFAVRLANHWQASSVLFLGLDLSYQRGLKYATRVCYQDPTYETETSNNGVYWNGRVEGKDQNGNIIPTAWKWKSEAKWLSDFATTHPEVEWLYGTEGGLEIPGIQFRNPLTTPLHPQRPYRDLIHASIQQCDSISPSIGNIFSFWIGKIQECITLIEKILNALIDHSSLLLFELELEENPVYQLFLFLQKKILLKVWDEEDSFFGENIRSANIYLYLLRSCVDLEEGFVDVRNRWNEAKNREVCRK